MVWVCSNDGSIVVVVVVRVSLFMQFIDDFLLYKMWVAFNDFTDDG